MSAVEGEVAEESLDRPKSSFAVVERNVDVAFSEPNNVCAAISCQVHDIPRVLADLPSLLYGEVVDHKLGRLERPISVVVRDPHSCGAEPDDVSPPVASEIGDITRVLVNLPSLSGSEVVDDEFDGTKSAVSVVQRGVDSCATTADDVYLPIAGQVGNEARVLLHAPATSAVAEIVDDRLHGGERPVAVVAADEDVVLAESYDVGFAISRDVAEEAEVALETPTASIVAEVIERDVGRLEIQIAIVPRNDDSAVSKSDDVASADASNIGTVADMLIDAPAAGIVGEILQDSLDRSREAVVALVLGDEGVTVSESNDVGLAVVSHVGDETDVFVDPPASCVVAEVFDRRKGLNTDAVTEDNNSILTKADDVREAWARGGNYGDTVSIHDKLGIPAYALGRS